MQTKLVFFLISLAILSKLVPGTCDVARLKWEDDSVGLMQQIRMSGKPLPENWTPGMTAVFWGAILFDFVWILYKTILATSNIRLSEGCDFIATLLWYPLTVLVQGWVFQEEDSSMKDNLAEAVNSATQQITSIGYGSSGGGSKEERLFHGLNAIASQIGPASFLGWTYELIRDSLVRSMARLSAPEGDETANSIMLFLAAVMVWLLFATDGLHGIDPWYTTMITATTIGYGDTGPNTADHKWLGAFLLPLLTNAWGAWWGAEGVVSGSDKESSGNCGVDLADWKVSLFNPYKDATQVSADEDYFKEVLFEIDHIVQERENDIEESNDYGFITDEKPDKKKMLYQRAKELKRMIIKMKMYEKYRPLLDSEAFFDSLAKSMKLVLKDVEDTAQEGLRTRLELLTEMIGKNLGWKKWAGPVKRNKKKITHDKDFGIPILDDQNNRL